MVAFGQALPAIRARIDAALALPGLPREKVLATVVYLLQATMMRIGNEEYARDNRSYGLTTLRNRHVRIDGGTVRFRFRGKSGVMHDVAVSDRRLARIIRRTRELPGQELFQYVDDDGTLHSVGSGDVNDYLRAIGGSDYTAKDFRTWHGSVLAAQALRACGPAGCAADAKKNVVQAIAAVARRLGNTPAVCRKCYVHPAVIDAYLAGAVAAAPSHAGGDPHALSPEEQALLALLQNPVAAAIVAA
jgi:DNA topoisomerase I